MTLPKQSKAGGRDEEWNEMFLREVFAKKNRKEVDRLVDHIIRTVVPANDPDEICKAPRPKP